MTRRRKTKSVFDTVAIVHWLDAASHDHWDDTSTRMGESGLTYIVSVGFLLEETDDEVKIIRSSCREELQNEGMFSIPKGMIIGMELKPYKMKAMKKPKIEKEVKDD